jgi:acyl-CoA synthetase (AMP-forming)/AMP-acid ligase II
LSFHSRSSALSVTLENVVIRARHVAAGLRAHGVRPGDVVAVQLPHRVETVIAYHAVAMCGAVLLPIVMIYGPSEVQFILEQSGARVFVTMSSWHGRQPAEAALKAGLDQLRAVVVVDEPRPGSVDWRTLEAADPIVDYIRVSPDAAAAVVYTSGTTAQPKGVIHTHLSLVAELRHSPTPPPNGTAGVSFQPFPPGHTAGLTALLAPALHGLDTLLLDDWNVERAADLIDRHGVRYLAGTPYHLLSLLDLAEQERASLRTIRDVTTGGAGVPPSLVERAEALGWRAARCYGSTELPSATVSPSSADLFHRSHTDGQPFAGNMVRTVDFEGRDVQAGEDGEILLLGPELFGGYVDHSLDRDALTATGWFHTGDLGHLDSDGYLTVTDRLKDIIIRGGENVSSKEVEDLLHRHPAIAEGACIPVPDPLYGERVGAVVVLRPGADLSLEDLRRFFWEAGVARQKTPEVLRIVPTLPRTPAGKVKKYELKGLAE